MNFDSFVAANSPTAWMIALLVPIAVTVSSVVDQALCEETS